MSIEFAIAEVMPGKLNALVKNIMKQTATDDPNEAVRLVNSGEWILSQSTNHWRRADDGTIRFSVASTGLTGPEWEKWFDQNHYDLSPRARFLLNSSDFKPTATGTTTEVGVLNGELFSDDGRTTHNIRLKAVKSKMILPEAEIACLIRRMFSDKEIKTMGLWGIVTMHDPINDSDGAPDLLGVDRVGAGRWLGAYGGRPGDRWDRDDGFVFVVSQVAL